MCGGGGSGGECVGVVGVVVNVWGWGRHRHTNYTQVWQSGCGDVGVVMWVCQNEAAQYKDLSIPWLSDKYDPMESLSPACLLPPGGALKRLSLSFFCRLFTSLDSVEVLASSEAPSAP